MASGMGFGLPEDEEPQLWRSRRLMSRTREKAKNCRMRSWLDFPIG
jgi:hypothetical protein